MIEPLRDDDTYDEALDDEALGDAPFSSGPGLPPPSAVESLVNALLEAGPEVAEHVVRAAQELLAAAQCIVDAADDAVHEQIDLRRERATETDATDGEPAPGFGTAWLSVVRRCDNALARAWRSFQFF